MKEKRKVILYRTSDTVLKQFELKFGRSLIFKRTAKIELPLELSKDGSVWTLRAADGKGFIIHPVSVQDTIFYIDSNDCVEEKEGFIVQTKNHYHYFYYV